MWSTTGIQSSFNHFTDLSVTSTVRSFCLLCSRKQTCLETLDVHVWLIIWRLSGLVRGFAFDNFNSRQPKYQWGCIVKDPSNDIDLFLVTRVNLRLPLICYTGFFTEFGLVAHKYETSSPVALELVDVPLGENVVFCFQGCS